VAKNEDKQLHDHLILCGHSIKVFVGILSGGICIIKLEENANATWGKAKTIEVERS
jgi:hypothetical protein